MTTQDRLDNLDRCLEALASASGWLARSFGLCRDIDGAAPYTAEQFDAFETLTSRFARTVDILIHKVYRAVDAVEMEEGGSILDVVNRAHKRGHLDSVERLRELKDIRNEIAHEYSQHALEELFADVLALTPELLALAGKARDYCEKYQTNRGMP